MTLISTIICTYNRAESLKKTLESLLRQESQGAFDYEILLVDNNSTDQSKSVIETFIPRFEGKLRSFFQPIPGKSLSMNMAIPLAKGDILAFTDDDVVLPPSWLYELYQCFTKYGCDGVGGRVLPDYPPQTPQWIKDNAVQLAGAVVIYEYGESTRPLDRTMHPFIGCNYAFRRRMFTEHGLFRPDLGPGTNALGEDTEFVERLLAEGIRLYYCGKARVWHPYDPKRFNWRQLARWHVAIGRCEAQREIQSKEKFIYYFGAPRYLLKGLAVDMIRLVIDCFNRLGRWNAWRSLFRKVGMILEYRRMHRQRQ